MMRLSVIFTFIIFSLSIHLAHGGIFRRYVRKHRPDHRAPHHQIMLPRSRMMMGPNLVERQFRISRQRPWPMFVRRARAPPLIYQYPMQYPLMLQTAQPVRSRASRRYRFHERLDSSRVPQFHHQPVSARHHAPIGISTTTRLPTTSALQWRPLDYGNPIDRDPTYDYAPPAVERVRFVTEVRGNGAGRQPTARANTGMLGMYSRPSPVVVPAPWKRDPNVRSRHPEAAVVVPPNQYPHGSYPPPPPPRGALPLWKLLAYKQRPRRPQRPLRPHQHQHQPQRFIGQDPAHPLYHHQVYHDEAEVFPHIPNILYFQPTDVSKHSYAKKNHIAGGKRPSGGSGALKPGSVSSVQLYSKEVSSSSEFRPIKPTRPASNKGAQSNGNKAYQFTVVGYSGPAATTPMSPVAAVPASISTTKRPPTVLYAVKTTPETLSTTHNSVVKPLEPTESLEPEEDEAASEFRPVHVRLESPSVAVEVMNEDEDVPEVEDGREQGGIDVDFDNLEETERQEQPAPVPVVPNSFNVFESLLSSFEKEFGGDAVGDEEANNEEEILEVKDNHHRQRVPVFAPAEESTLRGALIPSGDVTTAAPSRNPSFETSTSISVSVGVSSSSSSSSKKSSSTPPPPPPPPVHLDEDEEDDDTDGYFANIKIVPTVKSTTSTTTTSTTTTSTTTPKPSTSSEFPAYTERSSTTSTTTAYPRLPTMPTYKKKPTPVYARKSSKAGGLLTKYSSSSSSVSKEVSAKGGAVPNGSGEVVIITAGRSKVKEYKPQVIANQTGLLSFDKVISPSEGETVKEYPIPSANASPSSTSTTKSPLEDFDAMQLLHSWLNKA